MRKAASAGPNFHDSSDWSPGAPLLYAATFYATGGAREGTARIVEALLGVAAILVVFLLGERLGGRWVGLMAAFAVAVYPPVHPLDRGADERAAGDPHPARRGARLPLGERAGARCGPGSLPGPALRPDGDVPTRVPVRRRRLRRPRAAVRRRDWRRGWKPGLAGAGLLLAALLLPIVPWTIRNVDVLGRVVPISTGSGKALYVGTYLPADGEYQRVKAILYERYEHKSLPPNSEALNEVDPTPLFNRVAERYPDLPRDSALGKIGKQNFSKYFGEDPVGYLAMTARKVGRMWSSGVGAAMSSGLGRAIQILLVALGLAGFVLLGAAPIAGGSCSRWRPRSPSSPRSAPPRWRRPRRNEVLMTLVFPLAALALSRGVAAISSGREWSPEQASSPPN